MRDRLIELLCNVRCEGEECYGNCPYRVGQKCDKVTRLEMCAVFAIAEHLLAEGVIVSPCKVGDKVYTLVNWCDYTNCHFEGCAGCHNCNNFGIKEIRFNYSHIEAIGKTVFLTREEAERALAERREG